MSMLVDDTPDRIDLQLEGMTCASCAARIERKLNKLEGVEASVNFATERASVGYDSTLVEPAQLIAAVEQAGYGAAQAQAHAQARTDDAGDALLLRLLMAAVLTAPVVVVAMLPTLHFGGWKWLAFVFSTPVVFWAGWQFHRAALANARHLAATMDTLVSVGTLAAWLWSTVVLLGRLNADVYFEVGAVITTLILLGRFFELRARRSSGAAIRALLELGAKEAHVLRDGREVRVPV